MTAVIKPSRTVNSCYALTCSRLKLPALFKALQVGVPAHPKYLQGVTVRPENTLETPRSHRLSPIFFANALLPYFNTKGRRPVSIDVLIRNNSKQHSSKDIVWCVKSPLVKDPDGWCVVNWTRTVTHLLSSPLQKKRFDKCTADAANYLLSSEGREYLQMFAHNVKLEFDSMLPPGAVIHSDSTVFSNFLNTIDHHLTDFTNEHTVFRFPVSPSSSATFANRLSRVSPLTNAKKVDPRVVDAFPLLLKLLHHSLTYSNDDGFENWGIFWCSKGLCFYPARALNAAKSNPRLHAQYSSINTHDVFALCLDELLYAAPLPLTRDTPLTTYFDRDNVGLVDGVSDAIVSLVYESPKVTHMSALYNSDYSVLIPTTRKEGSLLEYYARLLDPVRASPPRIKRALKKNEPIISNESTRLRRTFPLSLRATDWGYLDTDDPEFFYKEMENPVSMTVSIAPSTTCNPHTLSFPHEIRPYLPELNKKEPFRHRTSSEVRVVDPSIDLDKTVSVHRTPLEGIASVYSMNTLFLHPALLAPNGEALTLAQELLRVRKPSSCIPREFLKAFTNLCRWIHEPQELLKELVVPAWLEVTVDPSSGCPVQLDTPTKRVDFLLTLAKVGTTPGLAYMPLSRDGGQDIRSGKLTDFDRFAIWYSAKKEMQLLNPPVTLNDRQLREYICYRWLPWRRPDSLRPHMVSGKFLRDDLGERPILPPQLPLDAPIADFVADQVANGRLSLITL